MNDTTKLGLGIFTSGIVLSLIGGIMCYKTVGLAAAFLGNLGDPVSYERNIEGDITEIDIDVVFSNIEIRKGDSLKVIAEDVPEKLELDFVLDDRTLEIENINDFSVFKKNNINIGGISDASAGKYIIYIPDKNFDDINIDAVFSSVSISDVNCNEIDIDCTFGEYKLNNIISYEMNFENAFGSSEIKNIECDRVDISNSFGEFKSQKLKINEYGDFENDFGNMNINLSGKNYRLYSNNFAGRSENSLNITSEKVRINSDSAFGNIIFTN